MRGETIDQLRQRGPFSCIFCKGEMRLKQGRRRPFFAHVSKCGGESALHKAWKDRIRITLEQRGLEVVPEAKGEARRYDLLITDASLAVEIQCSKMDSAEWLRRRALDQAAGVTTRWIGFKEGRGDIVRLDGWMKTAFFHDGFIDLVDEERLYRFTGSIPFSSRAAICQRHSLSLNDFLVYRMLPHGMPRRWSEIVARYRLRPFYSSLPMNVLRTPLYKKGIAPSLLPSICFLPLPALVLLPFHPFELQIALYLQLGDRPFEKERIASFLTRLLKSVKKETDSSSIDRIASEWAELVSIVGTRFFGPPHPSIEAARRSDWIMAGLLQGNVERE
ncbi:competence protein CoiA family protein [Exiguobacterium flavidum]